MPTLDERERIHPRIDLSIRELAAYLWHNTDGTGRFEGLDTKAMAARMAASGECLDVIARLLDWAEYMGGFEAKVWEDARGILQQAIGSPAISSQEETSHE